MRPSILLVVCALAVASCRKNTSVPDAEQGRPSGGAVGVADASSKPGSPEDAGDWLQQPAYLKPGMHPTPEAALAPGAEAQLSKSLDVNGDGVEDRLLTVHPNPDSVEDFSGSREAVVLALGSSSGWTLHQLATNPGSPNVHVKWLEPIVSGSTTFLVSRTIDDPTRSFETGHFEDAIYVSHASDEVKQVATMSHDDAKDWKFRPWGEATLLIRTAEPKFRTVAWHHTMRAPEVSPWMSAAPKKSQKPLPSGDEDRP